MINKDFSTIIKNYQNGDSQDLFDWIVLSKEIDIFHWYKINELFLETVIFGIFSESSYIKGSANYFKMAMQKVNKKEKKLSFENKLCIKFLADTPEDIENFLEYYKMRTFRESSYCLSDTLLKVRPEKPWTFWEGFYFNFIESISYNDYSDQEIYNIIKNANTIFDLDTSQHKAISAAIEHPNYPIGKAMTEALKYSDDFDKFILPRHDLSTMGRTEERAEFIKSLIIKMNKVELDNQLTQPSEEKKIILRNKV